jgi:hypothetical protein
MPLLVVAGFLGCYQGLPLPGQKCHEEKLERFMRYTVLCLLQYVYKETDFVEITSVVTITYVEVDGSIVHPITTPSFSSYHLNGQHE